MLLTILGCGFVSFAGFLYLGARTRRRSYWAFTLVYGVIGLVAVMLMDRGRAGSAMAGAGVVMLLGGWAASVAHGLAINADYLRWKALGEGFQIEPPAMRPATRSTMPQDVRPSVPRRAERDGLAVIATPEPPAEPVLVDVNTADVGTLAQLPGLDVLSARRIVEARAVYGEFESLEQAAALAPLRPSTVPALRPWVTVSGRLPY